MNEKDLERYIKNLEEIVQQRGIEINSIRRDGVYGHLSSCVAGSMSAQIEYIKRDSERLRHEIGPLRRSMSNPKNVSRYFGSKKFYKVLELLERVERHSFLAEELAENILSNRWTLPAPVEGADLNGVITKWVEPVREYHSFKEGIKFSLRLNRYIPNLYMRESELFQILFQLVKNSIEAFDSAIGGRIYITTDLNEGHVLLEIKDNGSGIDDGIRDRIFNLYFSTKPPYPGSSIKRGIGLFAVKTMIDQYGGWIDYDSDPGKMTCFRLFFPIQPDMNRSSGSLKNIDQITPPGREITTFIPENPDIWKTDENTNKY